VTKNDSHTTNYKLLSSFFDRLPRFACEQTQHTSITIRMRKIPVGGGEVGRASPTLTQPPTVTAPPVSAWGAGAPKPWATAVGGNNPIASAARPPAAPVNNPANANPGGGPGVAPIAIKETIVANGTGAAADLSRFKYSKEFILSLYDPNLKPPADFEPIAGLTVSDPLEPLANIPLTEQESKVRPSLSPF
jgi:hypothetical protein